MVTTKRTAAELMSSKTLTLEPETTVRDAGLAMARNHVHIMPVHSVHGGLLGVVGPFELMTCDNPDEHISAVMRTNLEKVKADTTAAAMAHLMMIKKLHHLLVVDDNDKLLGVVSSFDLLSTIE